MPTLTITPLDAELGYDRATRNLHARPVRYEHDGWPLLADNLQDALKEVKLMGESVDQIKVNH